MVDAVDRQDVGGDRVGGGISLGHLVDDDRFQSEALAHGGEVGLQLFPSTDSGVGTISMIVKCPRRIVICGDPMLPLWPSTTRRPRRRCRVGPLHYRDCEVAHSNGSWSATGVAGGPRGYGIPPPLQSPRSPARCLAAHDRCPLSFKRDSRRTPARPPGRGGRDPPGLLFPAGLIWSQIINRDRPEDDAPAELRFFDRHATELVASSLLRAVALLLLTYVALFLYRATKARNPSLNPLVLIAACSGRSRWPWPAWPTTSILRSPLPTSRGARSSRSAQRRT